MYGDSQVAFSREPRSVGADTAGSGSLVHALSVWCLCMTLGMCVVDRLTNSRIAGICVCVTSARGGCQRRQMRIFLRKSLLSPGHFFLAILCSLYMCIDILIIRNGGCQHSLHGIPCVYRFRVHVPLYTGLLKIELFQNRHFPRSGPLQAAINVNFPTNLQLLRRLTGFLS